jgi:hypothetical protein
LLGAVIRCKIKLAMEDWKGNKIQVGHTVIVVSTGSMLEGSRPCLLMMTENGMEKVFEGEPIKKSYSFDVSAKYFITEPSNNLTISMNDKPSKVPINHIGFWISKQPWQIVCIEGISDNKDEYYKDYFSA